MANIRSIVSTPTQAMRTADLCDKSESYPKRGVSASTGAPDGPTAFIDGAYGWTTFRVASNGSTFAAANGGSWLLANGTPATLTPAERAELVSLLSPARRFSSRWPTRFW